MLRIRMRWTAPPLRLALAACLAVAGSSALPRAAEPAPDSSAKLPTIEARTRGMVRREGFLVTYLDREAGAILLELPAAAGSASGVPVILAGGLTSGLGSNPVGLDRSLLARTRYAVFRRLGDKVLLEQPNLDFRAGSSAERERAAVRQSFATSVLWAWKLAARSGDGRLLVDLAPFLLRDSLGVSRALEDAGQGAFAVDPDRCAIDPDAALAFPDNLEFEALLTFSGKKPGPHVRETTPAPESVSLVVHHSLIRPPDDGYRPRVFDPRAGSYPIEYRDYAVPLDQPLDTRWIVRHRLEKVDPAAARSRVKKPIVYYVDPGAPEPVRSALVEGASWWAEAFEAAGFIDAFRVEILPEGAHPLDVRYNVIHWVHRSTRGWSYGGGMIDPRTGEMMKGNVLLGSLRVRHDRLLFEGLAGTARTGTGSPEDPVTLALARIRQLAAHEVGHALGFAHNFAASTYDRGSVMDYPAPLVKIREDGSLDFSSAYAVGTGAWDRLAVQYAYAQFPPREDEKERLLAIVQDGIRAGLRFLTDEDARPEGASHPQASLWDNGSDPVAEMEHVLRVRRIALSRFGEDAVAPGRPLALIHDTLVPVYFHHRYQLEATVKLIGGMEYAYALRGDGQPAAKRIDPARQRRALSVLLRLLEPQELDLSEGILELLVPRPFGFAPSAETIPASTSPAFDPLGAAATAASAVVAAILQPERSARLLDFHRRDAAQPSLEEILTALVNKGFSPPPAGMERLAAISGVVRRAVSDGLLALASDSRSPSMVRAKAEATLRSLASRLGAPAVAPAGLAAQDTLIAAEITRFLERHVREAPAGPRPAALPPGSPIGGAADPAATLAGCSMDGD